LTTPVSYLATVLRFFQTEFKRWVIIKFLTQTCQSQEHVKWWGGGHLIILHWGSEVLESIGLSPGLCDIIMFSCWRMIEIPKWM
jgi:hypothetical protein